MNLEVMFLGMNTSKFTVSKQLFLENLNVIFWRFEIVYNTSMTEKSSSALHVQVNQPPRAGHCSITPSNGNTSTIFSISCQDWFDEDGIKDFSFYGTSNYITLLFSYHIKTNCIYYPCSVSNRS